MIVCAPAVDDCTLQNATVVRDILERHPVSQDTLSSPFPTMMPAIGARPVGRIGPNVVDCVLLMLTRRMGACVAPTRKDMTAYCRCAISTSRTTTIAFIFRGEYCVTAPKKTQSLRKPLERNSVYCVLIFPRVGEKAEKATKGGRKQEWPQGRMGGTWNLARTRACPGYR